MLGKTPKRYIVFSLECKKLLAIYAEMSFDMCYIIKIMSVIKVIYICIYIVFNH